MCCVRQYPHPAILVEPDTARPPEKIFCACASFGSVGTSLGGDATKGLPEGSMNTSSYRWVIVAAGALMTCVAMGSMFSLAVYLEPMSTATGWSRADIGSTMTICF